MYTCTCTCTVHMYMYMCIYTCIYCTHTVLCAWGSFYVHVHTSREHYPPRIQLCEVTAGEEVLLSTKTVLKIV